MTPYDFVHLVIHATGGKIEGRTKLQKVVYFAGVLTGYIQYLGYRPHYYGPFSPAVAGAVQELRSLKFLEQNTRPDGTTDAGGFEKIRYDYALTAEGEQVAKEKAEQWPEEWKGIAEAAEKITSAKVRDYVHLAIAAKTDLLTREAGRTLSPSDLKERCEERGWTAFTNEQYDDAVRFLATVVGSRLQTTND